MLRRFKSSTTVGHLVERLLALHEQLDHGRAISWPCLHEQIRREWLAEAMIFDAIQILYSPASVMNVLTNAGNRYTFYVKDFVSGAVIANIVTRAKKSAVKRVVLGQHDGPGHRAGRSARRRSAWSLTRAKINSRRTSSIPNWALNEQLKFVELILQTGQIDPWNEQKLRPYETFA